MTLIYQPCVPKEGRTRFQMPYFPGRVGGERVASSLVGSLVFFLLAERGGDIKESISTPVPPLPL